jgi:hypothetical protein
MEFVTQEQIDFWKYQEFTFERYTNFNYIHYMEVLIERERVRLALDDQSQRRDDQQD